MSSWMKLSLALVLSVVCVTSRSAVAQGRVSDKDLQRMMENLKDDAQPFRKTFAKALEKSTIRKTSQETNARELGDTFAKQTDAALDSFKRNKKAEPEVTALVQTAAQIDPLVYSLQLGTQTTSQWEKLRSELHQVAQAFGISEPYLSPQAGSALAAQSSTGTCLNAVGVQRSRQLVNECLQVSSSTHPPCNAQNACSLIVDEIKRGCAQVGQGAPGFCAEYR
jgi:tellurite resistance protein